MGRISAVDKVMWKWALMNGIAFEGSEEPIVLFITTNIPMRTIAAFRFYHENKYTFKKSLKGACHTEDQLYGLSGSPSSQCMIFSPGVALEAAEFGIDILLSSSTLYRSVASC